MPRFAGVPVDDTEVKKPRFQGVPVAATAPTATAAANAKPPTSTLKDVAESLPSGLADSAMEMAMLPVTAHRLLNAGAGYVFDKGENLIRAALGYDPVTADVKAQRDQALSSSLNDAIYGAQDTVRKEASTILHKPETTAGKFAYTIGQFAAPGALPSRMARMAPTMREAVTRYAQDAVGNTLTPAVLSEAAGEATQGTALETPARIAGALTGNVGAAALRAYNAPEMVVRRAVGDVTPAQWNLAQALQQNNTGIRLTGPEAIAQATGGASALPDLLRVVEGSIGGRAQVGPFFAARPGQVDAVVGNVLDQIAPQSPNPSMLGPQASEAATAVIDQTRRDINAQTRPAYAAAEPQTIPQAAFAPIAADPRFQIGLQRLRANPALAPEYARFPDNSIAVVDAVTKDMAAQGEAMANRANPLYGPEAAARFTSGAGAARGVARTVSPEYDAALQQQADLRQNVLAPLENGPVGGVAAAQDTMAAGNQLLPPNPLVGGNLELQDAVARLAGQDPETTAALLRQTLADRYNKVSTETQGGDRQFVGAKLHKNLAGNQAREEALQAVLGALPNNQAAAVMPELLQVLQATGRRKPVGSATAFNQSTQGLLSTGTPQAQVLNMAKSLGASFITQATDAAKRAALHNSIGTLAELFMDPNSVQLIQNALNRSAPISLSEAAIRSGLQAPVIVQDPRRR